MKVVHCTIPACRAPMLAVPSVTRFASTDELFALIPPDNSIPSPPPGERVRERGLRTEEEKPYGPDTGRVSNGPARFISPACSEVSVSRSMKVYLESMSESSM